MKECRRCKIEKTYNEFSKNKRQKDGHYSYCKVCKKEEDARLYKRNPEQTKERNKRYIDKTKKWWKEYRTSLKCERCGENRFWVLEFHHQNPSEKEHNISYLTNKGYSIKTILKEINKCIVLCANCHRDHHYQEKINQ